MLYAPDPSSQSACTIGGNVAMNSGGPHTLKYGVTTNHVLGFEMVLPDGEVVWFGTRPDGGEDVEGYDLRGAVIGCEGMFGIITRALVRLIRAPQGFKTLLGIFENVDAASQTVSDIISAGIVPGAMEMMDQLITQAIEAAYKFGFPLDAGACLIIELDGLQAGLESQAEQCHRALQTKRRARSAHRQIRAGTHGSLEMPQARFRRHRPPQSKLSHARRRRPALQAARDHALHSQVQRKIRPAHPERLPCRRW